MRPFRRQQAVSPLTFSFCSTFNHSLCPAKVRKLNYYNDRKNGNFITNENVNLYYPPV
ncbi:hypothetical protein PRABACTJOHN_01303 [Parabacteroides johnsonii DSM 18315]|uniref:Uncharacterized protein n=1 Tax=Parabacteroides johnsonii DSM 18315 TaxID=537006 RepID=B7B8F3_9BACT|nr:hypothetical protein PRABACTJOHN_01303 [Parabacteroides johnsonii DSM 18315]